MAKNFLLVFFPSDESTAVIVNDRKVVLAGDVCKRGTISVLWSNGMTYKGRVVDFNEKRKPLADVQKTFVKALVESDMDFDAAFAKIKENELSDYEKMRQANIKELEEKKRELGLTTLMQQLEGNQRKKAKVTSTERIDDSEDDDSSDINETPEEFLEKLNNKNKAKKRKFEDKENNKDKSKQRRTNGQTKRHKKSDEEKNKESQERRCLVEASLSNIEKEILENKQAPYTSSPLSSRSAPHTPSSTLVSEPTCIQSPPLFPKPTGGSSLAIESQSSALQSTSPLLPVIVSSNSDQQAMMIGRLMETVHSMQQKIERMDKQIQKLLASKKTIQMPNVIELPEINSTNRREESSPNTASSNQSTQSHGSLVEELKEFLLHKSDFGRAVKECMIKVFTGEEMRTCSVRGKKSKQGKQRECLPGDKLSAIIDAVKDKFGQSSDVVYKMNQVLRNFPGRQN